MLHDSYIKILRALLLKVYAEDVVYTWSVRWNIAEQIIYDSQMMIERGPLES